MDGTPLRPRPATLPALHLPAVGLVALAIVALHLLVVGQYGIFRDEFYYLANGRHLAWGYVEHPPLVGVLGAIANLGGASPLAVRWLPILGSGVLVFLVASVARRLGGGGFAQAFAAAAVVTAPHFLFVFHVLSMNFAEVLLWSLGAWLLLVALQEGERWPWLAFGLVGGLGLLTKHSMAVFGLGILLGLALSRDRAVLRTPWPWIAGAIAAVIAAPHVGWQVQHDWPIVEFVRNAQREKIASVPLAGFFLELFGMTNMAASLLLVGLGLWWLLVRRDGQARPVIGWAWVAVVAVFVSQQGKPYYATPVFPPLMAAGAVFLERLTRARPAWRALPVTVVLAGAVAFAPLGLPVLPQRALVDYLRALGVTPSSGERHELAELPQHFADMHGWEDLARTISRVYLSLPEAERAAARVFARNYGQAGSLEYYSSRYPLPRVISPHNSYWLWGPGPDDGATMIVIGGQLADLQRVFEQVDEVARTACDFCMPYERGRPVFVGRGWKVPLSAIWPAQKMFI